MPLEVAKSYVSLGFLSEKIEGNSYQFLFGNIFHVLVSVCSSMGSCALMMASLCTLVTVFFVLSEVNSQAYVLPDEGKNSLLVLKSYDDENKAAFWLIIIG